MHLEVQWQALKSRAIYFQFPGRYSDTVSRCAPVIGQGESDILPPHIERNPVRIGIYRAVAQFKTAYLQVEEILYRMCRASPS